MLSLSDLCDPGLVSRYTSERGVALTGPATFFLNHLYSPSLSTRAQLLSSGLTAVTGASLKHHLLSQFVLGAPAELSPSCAFPFSRDDDEEREPDGAVVQWDGGDAEVVERIVREYPARSVALVLSRPSEACRHPQVLALAALVVVPGPSAVDEVEEALGDDAGADVEVVAVTPALFGLGHEVEEFRLRPGDRGLVGPEGPDVTAFVGSITATWGPERDPSEVLELARGIREAGVDGCVAYLGGRGFSACESIPAMIEGGLAVTLTAEDMLRARGAGRFFDDITFRMWVREHSAGRAVLRCNPDLSEDPLTPSQHGNLMAMERAILDVVTDLHAGPQDFGAGLGSGLTGGPALVARRPTRDTIDMREVWGLSVLPVPKDDRAAAQIARVLLEGSRLNMVERNVKRARDLSAKNEAFAILYALQTVLRLESK
jgi:hypothetical protein